MSFGHGKNIKAYVNGYDLTGYFDSIDQSGSAKTAETTTFGALADTFVAGTKNGTLSAEGFFDGSANAVDAILAAALAGATNWLWWPQGDVIGGFGYGMSALNTAYAVKGSISAAVRVSASAQSNVGIERVQNLHALAAETAGASGAAQDGATATTAGGSAYLEVTTSNTGGTVVVEDSADGSTGWATIATFSTISGSAKTAERIAITGNIKRYTRCTWTIAGTTMTFNCAIHRN